MATLTISMPLLAMHGTEGPRESEFAIEVTLVGALHGDFVAGCDDSRLRNEIAKEILLLKGTRLDDVVGRATLENIATYLVTRLCHLRIESVAVSLDGTKVIVSASEIDSESCEGDFAFKRGVSLFVRGKVEEALTAFSIAMQLAPNTAKVFNARGRCLCKMGRLTEAIADYSQAITLEHEFGEAYRNRGNALLELGRREDAIVDFTRAIAIMPTSALAYNNRGFAYQAIGAYEKALSDHDRAIELDPAYEEAFRDRATALMKLGKVDLARQNISLANALEGSRSNIDIEWAKLMGNVYQPVDCRLGSHQPEAGWGKGCLHDDGKR